MPSAQISSYTAHVGRLGPFLRAAQILGKEMGRQKPFLQTKTVTRQMHMALRPQQPDTALQFIAALGLLAG